MSRVALVTGAARGIGAATVTALAEQGWSVVATDRCSDDPRIGYRLGTREELELVAAEATLRGGRVLALQADTCDRTALQAAVDEAVGRFGALHAVVAVAGVVAGGVPLWEQPEDELDAIVEVNLRGVMTAARVGIPALLQSPPPRSGRFLAVSSAAASRGLPMLAAYGAAKSGVNGLVRGLAAELRGTGVTANCVSPGSTRTPVLEESARLYRLPDTAPFAAQQAVGRLLEPAEIAAALVWLAGEGSGGITGVEVPVDGGFAL